MPKAMFYTHVAERLPFACRLIETVCRKGLEGYGRLWVWLDSEKEARQLDKLLWTFQAASFIAHECFAVAEIAHAAEAPVWLVYGKAAAGHPESGTAPLEPLAQKGFEPPQLLLNLAAQAPFLPRERALEIIGSGEADLAWARERFRYYRQAGFALEHHRMDGAHR